MKQDVSQVYRKRHLSLDGDNLHLSGTVMVLEVEGLLAIVNNPKKNLAFALLK